jgi:RNA polymerase sigma-70 factor (ECF subfamily)
METIPVTVALALYDDLRPSLVTYTTKILLGDRDRAHDVVQEAFCRLHKQKYEALSNHVKPWLFNVCRNLAFKTLYKNRRLVFKESENIDEIQPSLFPSPLEILLWTEKKDVELRLLQAALETLKPRARRIIKLKFYDNLKYQEIAEIEKMTVGNVGFAINDAVSRIRAAYVSLSKKRK